MKKVLVVILVVLVLSCKKTGMVAFKGEIAGKWELEKFIGFGSYTLPPDNGKIIVLLSNGSFERRQHDTVVFRGSYTLQKKNDCYTRSTNTVLSTNEPTSPAYMYIEVQEGKLMLSTPNCYQDGGTAYYRRIN